MIPKRKRILSIILGGGKGSRLFPLTKERTKPAVPFAGKYRIVDFVLSNFVNSGLRSIYVLVQYRSQSLIEHLRMSWRARGLTHDEFITVVPPQMMSGENWYRGTADAVAQNLNLIYDFNPDLVVVFGSDHVYRMDINQMIHEHCQSQAEVTVATLPVPIRDASAFGIVEIDAAKRIRSFAEKPALPACMPGDAEHALASLGNYIFNKDTLLDVITNYKSGYSSLDFGGDILPVLLKKHDVHAYNFLDNKVPGIKEHEQVGYWRDIGTLAAYWEAHMDLLSDKPLFDLSNPRWNIHSGRHDGCPSVVHSATLINSMFAGGCVLNRCTVKNSIIGRDVEIKQNVTVEDSVIMDGVVINEGAHIKKAIIDRYNTIPRGTVIGQGQGTEHGTYYKDSQLMVIPRASRIGTT